MRVHELAKELNITTKELLEKANKELDLNIKSHSLSLTPKAVEDIRALYRPKNVTKVKPKAFVVKKQKTQDDEVVEAPQNKENGELQEVKQVEKKNIEPLRAKSRLEIVRRAPTQTQNPHAKPFEKKPYSTKKPYQKDDKFQKDGKKPFDRNQKPYAERQNRPQGERAPRAQGERGNRPFGDRPARPFGERPARPYGDRPARPPFNKDQRPGANPRFQKDFKGQKPDGTRPQRPSAAPVPPDGAKTPIKRHIISQEMYNNKNFRGPAQNKKRKDKYSKEEEQERISLEKATHGKHKKHIQEQEQVAEITQVVIDKPMTIGELSEKTGKTSAEIVKALMLKKILVTVNTPIDIDTAKALATDFGLEVLDEDIDAFIEEETEKEEKENFLSKFDEKLIIPRAPVVTIMGHVDHGKTTLLDSIRASKHKIVSDEVGGITQSIGAYSVWLGKKKIVFIDTPGHEAFTQMRMRGAQSTDIAILVVAADDGIMPQTIEAISHAKLANVPIIVAVNKIDKPDANPDKILQQLTEHGLTPEQWGGDTICVKVSALQKTGIDELLEYILLVADMQNLKTVEKCLANGVVIEANLDKGKGPVASVLVQNGTLKIGDCIVAGTVGGRVRALLDDSGQRVRKVGPSTPVEVLGLVEVPQAGDYFEVVATDKEMKELVSAKKQKERSKRLEAMTAAHVKKDSISNDEIKILNLIIKANTHGSAEAVSQAITNVKSSRVIPKIIHAGVGDISEADLLLASASDAVILGFSVKEDSNCLNSEEYNNVTIKKYDIIYQVLEDVEKTMLSLLEPEIQQVELGKAEVRQIFTIGKVNKIAGCYVTEGKIVRSKQARVLRNDEEVFKGEIDQLKRFKDDVKEVATGFECGISFFKFNDIQVGDVIEVSTTKEVERVSLV